MIAYTVSDTALAIQLPDGSTVHLEGDDADSEGLPKGPRLPRLAYFLAHVARVVRTAGYVSASKAEVEGGKSTAREAWDAIDYGAVIDSKEVSR
jgi:hypothetical protein